MLFLRGYSGAQKLSGCFPVSVRQPAQTRLGRQLSMNQSETCSDYLLAVSLSVDALPECSSQTSHFGFGALLRMPLSNHPD